MADDDMSEVGARLVGSIPSRTKVRTRRRRSRPRSRTISPKGGVRAARAAAESFVELFDAEKRPATRRECSGAERPCPFVSCKHHLYLDVNPETGSIKLNFPEVEPWDLVETCALDVAERGAITLEEVGLLMNLTRERVRQLEVRGLLKIKMASPSPDEVGALALALDQAEKA